MDAEKLPEVTPATPEPCVPGLTADACSPARCRTCALEVLDCLLSIPGAVSGEEADLLLDLRHAVKQRSDAELALRLFCMLRRRIEQRHYLALYRLRRWFENNVVAEIGPSHARNGRVSIPLQLSFYCVEALRRQHLCTGLQAGAGGCHLSFRFR